MPKFDIAAAIAKNRAKAAITPEPVAEKERKRGLLFGTGLNKKLAAKQLTAAKHQSEEIGDETIDAEEVAEKQHALADDHSASIQIAAKEITLDKYQSAALDTLKTQRFGCLIGAAGTGKTTLEQRLITTLKSQIITDDGLAMALVAFTGRAVQQIKRAVPLEYHPLCQTIHAFLGYMPDKEEYETPDGEWKERMVFRPTFTKDNPLPHKLVFIDEAGMLSVDLWNKLIDALPKARIIMIGDINQLPPVQGKSILGFAMCSWPTYELLQIHRQAADNPIIMNAHNVLNGKLPVAVPGKFDIVDLPDGSLKTQTKFIQVIKHLANKDILDPFRDGVIVPKNIDNLGQIMLNEQLIAFFNPDAKRELIACGWENKSFAVGDKVMLLQNDRERNLTNGMTGIVINISLNDKFEVKRSPHVTLSGPDHSTINFDAFEASLSDAQEESRAEKEADTTDDPNQRAASHSMTVRFPLPGDDFEEVIFTTVGQFNKITHAYVFTCHKSQGGEYPVVVILCHYSDWNMLTREWLYTAITRAQQRVVLCCNTRGLLQAVNTQKIYGNTVQEKAKRFLELQGNEKIEPNLPSPETM